MKLKKGSVCITLGLLLVAAALALSGYNIWDDQRAGQSVDTALASLETAIPDVDELDLPEEMIPDYVLNPKMEMPEVQIQNYDYIGRIEIPRLGLSLPVMDSWSYPNLKIAPCRFSGSAYQDNLVIAAHNYRRHFGPLKNLVEGDTITFTDVDGNVFTYQTALLEQVQPNQTREVQDSEWDLTLFTCTLGGQFRLVVRCERVEDFGQIT